MAKKRLCTPSMHSYACLIMVMIALFPVLSATGQSGDPRKDLQQQLSAQLSLTTVTNNRSDLVKPGSIFVLQKNGLHMVDVVAPIPPLSTYKNGKLSQGFGSSFGRDFMTGMASPGGVAPNYAKRTFASGERFWLTGVTVENDGVLYQFYSDPYDDVRYYGLVKIPFAKGTIPSVSDLMKGLAEVATAQSFNGDAVNASPATHNQSVPQQAALAPIAPPPPPSDVAPTQPKTVAVGQTKDQVVAAFGPPQKVVNLGAKEIDYYPDMKVVFLKGKVSDVQ